MLCVPLFASCSDSSVDPAGGSLAASNDAVGVDRFDVWAGDRSAVVYWSSGSGDSLYRRELGLDPDQSVGSVELLLSETGPESGFRATVAHARDGADSALVDSVANGRPYWVRLRTKDLQGRNLGESTERMFTTGPILEPVRRVVGVEWHSSFAWSPTADRVAIALGWTEPVDAESRRAPGSVNLAVLEMSEGTIRAATRFAGEGYSLSGPAWSHDGSTLAFAYSPSTTSGEFDYRIWIVPVDGGSPEAITAGRLDDAPAWLPSGDVVFSRRTTGDATAFDEIYRADAHNGWAVRKLTDDPRVERKRALCASPAGDAIAYLGTDGVYTVSADGGDARRIVTDAPYFPGGPSWTPDGTRILFRSNRCGHDEVWSVDTTTGELLQVTRGTRQDIERTAAQISPDGSFIAYLEDVPYVTNLVIARYAP